MRSEELDKFNEKIIKQAIKKVDTEALSSRLAQEIEEKMMEAFDRAIEEGFDFQYWLTDELTNDKTPAGKQFKNAMNAVAKKMADSISD